MLYPVILHADNNSPDDAHRSSATCAMLLDITRPVASEAPRIGVVAFAYLGFPASEEVDSVTTEEELPYPKMAVAINSRNRDGLYPAYPDAYDGADIGLSPSQTAGGLRLTHSNRALLEGEILTALLATTALPDPSDTERSQAAYSPSLSDENVSYVVLWSGRQASSGFSIRPSMLPSRNRAALRRLINAGGPSTIVGCWGGHLLSMGLIAPFILNCTGGRFRLSYSGVGLMREGGVGSGTSRSTNTQYLPHLRCRGEVLSDIEHYLFRAHPSGDPDNQSLLALILQGQARTYDKQMQVPMPVILPSGGHRLAEPRASVVYNESTLLDYSRPFSGAGGVMRRGVCPMSLSFNLPLGPSSPAPITCVDTALAAMFTSFGDANPFVATRQQEGSRNNVLFADVYGAATMDVEMASDTVRSMVIRAGMDTALHSSRLTATSFGPLPAYSALEQVDQLLRVMEGVLPDTILSNMLSLESGRSAVSDASITYSVQTAVATLAAIASAYVEARVQGWHRDVRNGHWGGVRDTTIAGLDSILDSAPFSNRAGLTGNYSDKLCNWLQIATTQGASDFIRGCLVTTRARGNLVSIIAESLRELLGTGDAERSQRLADVSANSLREAETVRGAYPRSVSQDGRPLLAGLATTGESVPTSGEAVPTSAGVLQGRLGDALSAFVHEEGGLPHDGFSSLARIIQHHRHQAEAASTSSVLRNALDAASHSPITLREALDAGVVGRSTPEGIVRDERYGSRSPTNRGSRQPTSASASDSSEMLNTLASTVRRFAASVEGRSIAVAVAGPHPNPAQSSAHRGLMSMTVGNTRPSVQFSPRTRSTEVEVAIPVTLRFTASFTDSARESLAISDGDDRMMHHILANLLFTALEHRFGMAGGEESHPSVQRGSRPLSASAATKPSAKAKRRLVIPEGGDKS